MVVSNYSVVILLGKGDGTFQAPQSYAIPYPGDVAYAPYVGDLNGDGIPDLLVTTGGLESVLLGNGDGTFQTAKTYLLGDGYDAALGDLNGDGKLDVVVSSPGIVSVSLGVGDGTFGPRHAYSTTGQYPVIVDINQDGIPDIAVTSATNQDIEVLLGNGDGTFQTSISYVTTPGVPGFMIQGDFNGDRRPDLVASTSQGNVETVVLNAQTVTLNLAGLTLPDPDKYEASYTGDSIFAANTSNQVLAPAGINATTSVLQFGEIPFGTTKTLQLTITDFGLPGTVTVTGASSGPSYQVLTNTCLAGISAGQSCALGIEFSPYGVGIKNDTLTLTPSGGGAASTVNLMGIGGGTGLISETPIDFGTIPVGTTKVLPLTVLNQDIVNPLIGPEPSSVQSVTSSGSSFIVVGGPGQYCGLIEPYFTCELYIRFAPTAVGDYTAVVTVTPESGSGAASMVTVHGTAAP